jgi:sulfoxide reductase catalytic subunit YedY
MMQPTDEALYLGRRRFLQLGAVAVAAASLHAAPAGLYPAKRNDRYKLDRPLSDENVAGRNNIFDEFSLNRQEIWKISANFATAPWAVHVGGAVKKEKKIDVEDLARLLGVEERLYRHRCVEAWAMAVPWTGIPLVKFVAWANPLSSARYLRMVSYGNPEKLPGWYGSKRVFPYYEALTLAEATNDLALLATGIYGHALPPQHGAPIRLVVPWKYGFKSIKSIVSFQFTAERPGTFWNDLAPDKFAWESNVDPRVARPWPQEQETMVGTGETRKTLLYNGYADTVAGLYA